MIAVFLVSIILTLSATGASASPVGEDSVAPNPFADFETFVLPNGLRVWFKLLPQDPNVSISISIPYGSDDDPPGLEELAHFTEHMLFSDHMGRTEEQIKAEIEDLGGSRNGLTFPDHTYYYAQVESRHAIFAIEWLYRLVSPHDMKPEIVERQRTPIAIELGARPRELLDWIQAIYIDPPFLRLPGFWKREFGLSTRANRDYYPYRSLQRITSENLRQFYDTFYVPSRMTLIVIGDIDRAAAIAEIEETFATLPSRVAPPPAPPLRDPQRGCRIYQWENRSDVEYSRWFKLYAPTAREQQLLHFVVAYLQRDLNKKLRYGEQKAVYGLGVGARYRREATGIYIYGGIKKEELAFAREVIEAELDSLREGTLTDDEFETAREAIVSQWRKNYSTAKELDHFARYHLYNPDRFTGFPDLVTFGEGVSRGEVVEFAQTHFVPEREVFYLTRPLPLRQEALILIGVVILWLTISLSRRLLIRPVDMSRIRYVARFRVPLLIRIVAGAVFLVVLAVVGRLLVFGAMYLWSNGLQSIDNFWVQGTYAALVVVLGLFVLILALSRVPRKLLVFEDHLRIKYLFYRSRIFRPEDFEELVPLRFHQVFLSRRFWRCTPLTFGVIAPGIYLRLRNGRGVYFRVRRQSEAMRAISNLCLYTAPGSSDKIS